MTLMKVLAGVAAAGVIAAGTWVYLATTPNGTTRELTAAEKALVDEHVFGGLPSSDNLYIRKGYVLCYNPDTRTPRWVAFHVKPDYVNTPKREGEWAKFRDDPDIDGEAKDADYKGLMASRGYARGHLAPYAIMGGDRDGDGKAATEDEDDAQTVYQANYMSNMAPQHQDAFNGSAGLWYKLERWIQDTLVKEQGKEVWVFAGCIFGPGEQEKVGSPDRPVTVPPMFYQIIVTRDPAGADRPPIVLAFLLPHQRSAHGDKASFLVSVNVIEALTGLDFFRELGDTTALEDGDTWEVWRKHFAN